MSRVSGEEEKIKRNVAHLAELPLLQTKRKVHGAQKRKRTKKPLVVQKMRLMRKGGQPCAARALWSQPAALWLYNNCTNKKATHHEEPRLVSEVESAAWFMASIMLME